MAKIIKVNPELIKLDEECYPRVDGLNNTHLDLLRNAGKLPPIRINPDMWLIDGRHRLTLALMEKKPEVEAIVEDIPKGKILARATQLNAKYGMQLSLKDKKRVALKLFSDGHHKVPSLTALLGLSTRAINKWTSDIRETREKTRNEKILDLYLEGWTEAEIGKKLAVSRQTVSDVVVNARKGIDAEIGIPDPPQIGDVWLFASCDDDFGLAGFPGRIPGEIVENLLHFYTEPFDLIVDPMSGGGTTLDVSKAMYRRCLAYDLKVLRPEIRSYQDETGIKAGLPQRVRRANLIILDPPYYKKKDDAYYPGSISALEREEYLTTFQKIAYSCHKALNQGGYLALIMSNYLDEQNISDSIWIWDYVSIFKKAKFTPIREIQCPLTTQSLHPSDMEGFRETERMAKFTRSIVVFKK